MYEAYWGRSAIVLRNVIVVYMLAEQVRRCKYEVTLRHVRVTIIAVEKRYVLHIVSVCL